MPWSRPPLPSCAAAPCAGPQPAGPSSCWGRAASGRTQLQCCRGACASTLRAAKRRRRGGLVQSIQSHRMGECPACDRVPRPDPSRRPHALVNACGAFECMVCLPTWTSQPSFIRRCLNWARASAGRGGAAGSAASEGGGRIRRGGGERGRHGAGGKCGIYWKRTNPDDQATTRERPAPTTAASDTTSITAQKACKRRRLRAGGAYT